MFIVEWYNRPHFSDVGSATFEVILFEGSNEILFQYEDVDFGDRNLDLGASATVGLNYGRDDGESVLVQLAGSRQRYRDPLDVVDSSQASADQTSATVNLADPDIDVTPTSLTQHPAGGHE